MYIRGKIVPFSVPYDRYSGGVIQTLPDIASKVCAVNFFIRAEGFIPRRLRRGW